MAFERFGSLPPELRIQIWEKALSVPTVWAATRNYDTGYALGIEPTHICKRFIGPEPYLAGLACRESRQLMERSFSKPLRGWTDSMTAMGASWVYLDRTVIYLGDTAAAAELLATLDADEVTRFRHVALSDFAPAAISSDRIYRLHKVRRDLEASCPDLQTIIIQRVDRIPEETESVREVLSGEMADLYATVLEHPEFVIGHEERRSRYLQSLLHKYLGVRHPNIHLLSPEIAVPLP
ncbi:hypothetical protein BCR34DRAFT_598567 [Clohesyomyces aquaticus]|uniref:2EXR domain-containing protein n=1 Tax=Clohesyomyces aquaticus TaxID=1231657 RepID=A0A1Y1ZYJ7_9PLEO|nr:hypothetical protein BCR34DRAFT_598567 [Clohesyomyces aquaticus]